MDLVEVLNFLFQLGSLELGQVSDLAKFTLFFLNKKKKIKLKMKLKLKAGEGFVF